MTKSAHCPSCGAGARSTASFCSECGSSLVARTGQPDGPAARQLEDGKGLTPRQQVRKEEWEATHPPRPSRGTKTFGQKWTRVFGIIFLASFAIGLIFQRTSAGPVFLVIILISGALAIIPPGFRLLKYINNTMNETFAAASRPVPSPQHIAWQLQQEWGRPPTVEEVAAVQQILVTEKNQALLNTGITLGAVYLMNKNMHRK